MPVSDAGKPPAGRFKGTAAADWYRDELLKWGMNFHWHPWEPVAQAYEPGLFAEQFRQGGIRVVSLEAKCALGWSYYPTAYGVVHPKLSQPDGAVLDYFGDRTRVVTENNGQVIAYYCVGMEGPLFHDHPDWRWHTAASWDQAQGEFRLPPHAENTWELTSLFSPYVDEVLLPQLAEIVERYPVSVMWLDIYYADRGHPDYNPHARKQFRTEMGRELLPLAQDPDLPATMAYFRRAGRRVRRRIVDAIHEAGRRVGRDVQVAINWLHSGVRPPIRAMDEPVDIDLLSCDVVQEMCGNVYELGLQARFFASLGLPSDVTSTNFRWWGEWDMKPPDVLKREAAITLANGSTYYIYECAYSHGRFEPGRIERLRRLADWVEERGQVFRRTGKARAAQPCADVTLLVSSQSYASTPHEHWLREGFESLEGASRLLQSSACSYCVCDEAGLAGCLALSRLVVLPHVFTIDEASAALICSWVEGGGKLLVAGPMPPQLGLLLGVHTEAAALRTVEASKDVEPLQEFLGQDDLQRAGYGYLAAAGIPLQGFEPVPLIVWGRFYPFEASGARVLMDYRYPLARAALESGADYGAIMGYSAPGDETALGVMQKDIGQAGGAVLHCGADVFRSFWRQPNYRFHDLLRTWMHSLGYQPSVTVTEYDRPAVGVEVVTARDPDDGALLVHVINLREANSSGIASERLPTIHGLQVRVQGAPDTRFAAVLHPHGVLQPAQHVEGDWVVNLPPLEAHICIEIQQTTT